MSLHERIIETIEICGRTTFARSSGPGGQNVNKVNTSVLLTLPIKCLDFLDEGQLELLRRRLSGRINSADEIFVRSQVYRSQHMNRSSALLKMAELITEGVKKTPVRKRTRPSKAAKENRLKDKKRRSELKRGRRFFD